jgi:hypothetical protein
MSIHVAGYNVYLNTEMANIRLNNTMFKMRNAMLRTCKIAWQLG